MLSEVKYNMNGHKRKFHFHFEIFGTFLALCAGLLGILADRLGVPSQAYLPVIFGFLITAAASLLKAELMERIDSSSRVQSLLNQINREGLYNEEIPKKGMEIVQKYESELENLSRGILMVSPAEQCKIRVERTNRTRDHIQATHLVPDISY